MFNSSCLFTRYVFGHAIRHDVFRDAHQAVLAWLMKIRQGLGMIQTW